MRIRHRVVFLVGVLLPVLVSSCVETIDFSKALERKLVVNCILTTGKEQTLRVSFNDEVGSYMFVVPEDVDASLFCDGSEVGKFRKVAKGEEWKLEHEPVPGGKYRLSVSVPGWDVVTAETTFPQSSPPVFRYKSESNLQRSFIQTGETSSFWVFVMNQPVEEWNILMRNPHASEKDHLCENIGTDYPGVDGFNALTEPVTVSYGVEGKTIRHYIYLRMAPTVAQYPLRFSLEWPDFEGSLVYFRSVSEEYDRYLKTSLQKVLAVQNEEDPTYWFDEGKVFSNVNGGLGIFGAYCDYVVQINYYSDYYFNRGIPYDEWPFDI